MKLFKLCVQSPNMKIFLFCFVVIACFMVSQGGQEASSRNVRIGHLKSRGMYEYENGVKPKNFIRIFHPYFGRSSQTSTRLSKPSPSRKRGSSAHNAAFITPKQVREREKFQRSKSARPLIKRSSSSFNDDTSYHRRSASMIWTNKNKLRI